MKKKGHLIKNVQPGSIADQLELEAGDRLLAIDGHEIEDVFDYQYYCNSESAVLLVEKADGEEWELEIEHGGEDLGLDFGSGLMSEYRTCRNRCVFCFIDQMPPGMRDTLYFKDDDSRLSFLQGNYITLTNMNDRDVERIIKFKLSPINISVHTTNPDLRCEMLHNRFAGESLKIIDRLYEAGTPMNGQIVLCKGVNDGEELERTIGDLSRYIPCMESVSVVPVGLSKYRDGLCQLEPFDKYDAAKVIGTVERWQKILYERSGLHFIHASDEFYILAGRPMPEEERYDGYLQLENGVGMVRLLMNEVEEEAAAIVDDGRREALSIATGALAYPFIQQCAHMVCQRLHGRSIQVFPIKNDFFGPRITVAGLITGRDLISQLKGKNLGERLLLPECMFRNGEEVFLDDLTREDLQNALQVPVDIVKSSGREFVEALMGPVGQSAVNHGAYEPMKSDRNIGGIYE